MPCPVGQAGQSNAPRGARPVTSDWTAAFSRLLRSRTARAEAGTWSVAAVAGAQARGGRVIAVGTTVVRALEGSSAARGGELAAGSGLTDLHIDEGFALRLVSGLLTGIHEPSTSHHRVLRALAPLELLDRALAMAEERGFLGHEFGDAMLLLGALHGVARDLSDRDGPNGIRPASCQPSRRCRRSASLPSTGQEHEEGPGEVAGALLDPRGAPSSAAGSPAATQNS